MALDLGAAANNGPTRSPARRALAEGQRPLRRCQLLRPLRLLPCRRPLRRPQLSRSAWRGGEGQEHHRDRSTRRGAGGDVAEPHGSESCRRPRLPGVPVTPPGRGQGEQSSLDNRADRISIAGERVRRRPPLPRCSVGEAPTSSACSRPTSGRILKQRGTSCFVREPGAMVGNGEVWFSQTCTNTACSPPGPVRIIAGRSLGHSSVLTSTASPIRRNKKNGAQAAITAGRRRRCPSPG